MEYSNIDILEVNYNRDMKIHKYLVNITPKNDTQYISIDYYGVNPTPKDIEFYLSTYKEFVFSTYREWLSKEKKSDGIRNKYYFFLFRETAVKVSKLFGWDKLPGFLPYSE